MSDIAYVAQRVNEKSATVEYVPAQGRQLWGAGPIGKAINRTPRQTHHLLSTGAIKSARKVRGRWTANEAALIREFGGA
jgi:hypothetical protein